MWRTVKLGDVCNIVNGSTPSRTENRYWADGDIPWFTIDDMREQGREIISTAQHVTQTAVDEKKVKLVPRDSVLLCCTASIGEAAIARKEMATNQQFNALTPKEDTLLCEYLYYVATTLKEQLLKVSGSTTISFVSMGKLKEIEISLPPLAEQQRIVAKLDAAFAEIDRAVEVAALRETKLTHLITSILSSKLSLSRFENVKLGQVAKVVGGNGFPHKFQGKENNEFPFYKVSDMNLLGNEVVMNASNNTVDASDLKSMKARAHPAGTVIFPKIGGAISTNKKRLLSKPAAFDNNVMGVVPSEKVLPEYLYKLFLIVDLYELSNKAALPSITSGAVNDLEFPLPALDMQQKIVDELDFIFSQTDAAKHANRAVKDGYVALKSAILAQELQPREAA